MSYNINILFVVRAIVTNNNGEVLLLKRNKNRQYNSLQWELPGGKIRQEEEISYALERILQEENSLVVKNVGKRYYIFNRHVTEPGKYQGYNYFEVALSADYVSGKVSISKEDHEGFTWVKPEEALTLDLSLESKKSIIKYMDAVMSESTEKGIETKVVVVSRALIQNDDGKYLFLKRSKNESYNDLWEIPGGKLDSFESLQEHLSREVLEETGLLINITTPSHYVHSFIPKDGRYKGVTFLNLISSATIKAGKIRLSPEHDEYKWVSEDEIFDYPIVGYLVESLTALFLAKK